MEAAASVVRGRASTRPAPPTAQPVTPKTRQTQERVPGRPRPLAFTAVVLGAMLIVAAMIGLLWLPAQRVNAGTVPSVNADPPAH